VVQVLREALSLAAAFERTADARPVQPHVCRDRLAFARYLSLDDGPPDGRSSDAALATSMTSAPRRPARGQGLLRRAFAHYTAALSAEGKARAELLLLANLEVGFHEQTRLQPEIRAAMDAPIYEPAALRRRLLDELLPDPGARLRLAVLRLGGQAAPLLAARDRVADEAQRLGRQAITAALMTLELPRGRVLRLGHDLTATFRPR
jgi:hypothetical protein